MHSLGQATEMTITEKEAYCASNDHQHRLGGRRSTRQQRKGKQVILVQDWMFLERSLGGPGHSPADSPAGFSLCDLDCRCC